MVATPNYSSAFEAAAAGSDKASDIREAPPGWQRIGRSGSVSQPPSPPVSASARTVRSQPVFQVLITVYSDYCIQQTGHPHVNSVALLVGSDKVVLSGRFEGL